MRGQIASQKGANCVGAIVTQALTLARVGKYCVGDIEYSNNRPGALERRRRTHFDSRDFDARNMRSSRVRRVGKLHLPTVCLPAAWARHLPTYPKYRRHHL